MFTVRILKTAEDKSILHTADESDFNLFSVDLMQDNVDECRARLLKIAGDTPKNRAIVEWNIRQGDGTTFDYEVEFDRELKAKQEQFEKDQNDLFRW